MSLGFPFGFYVANPAPLDAKYNNNGVPYANAAEVLSILPIGVRYEGLKVRIGSADFEFAADLTTLNPSGGGGGVPIALGAGPNAGNTPVFTSDLGIDLAVPIMSFNNNAFSQDAAGGWLNTILGSGSGGALNGGGANVILGNKNLPNLIGTGEFNGSQNVAIGWDIGDTAIAGSQNVFIGRQVSKGLLGTREYFYASLIGYEAGKGTEGLAANSLDGHTLIGTVAGALSKFSAGYSTILGAYAGYNSPKIGNRATFIGYQAGSQASYAGPAGSTPGQNNTFIGYRAGFNSGQIDYGAGNTFSHSNNTFIGGATGTNANVDRSTFVGVSAGVNAIGEKHFALGSESMNNLGASAHNGGVGNFAGWQNDAAGKLTGGYNYFFGEQSGYSIATLANTINIGHYSKNTLSNSINIGGFINAARVIKQDVRIDALNLSLGVNGNTGAAGNVLTADGAGLANWSAAPTGTASQGVVKVGNDFRQGGQYTAISINANNVAAEYNNSLEDGVDKLALFHMGANALFAPDPFSVEFGVIDSFSFYGPFSAMSAFGWKFGIIDSGTGLISAGIDFVTDGVSPASNLMKFNIPTIDPGVPGAIWNDAGTLKISL